jgi:hypothetical protein
LVVGATTAVIDDLVEFLVENNNLSLTTEDSGGAIGLLALNALLLLLTVVLSLGALLLDPAAVLWLTLEVTLAGVGVGANLVLILSVALLVLAWVVLAGSGLALEGSIGQPKLLFLRG